MSIITAIHDKLSSYEPLTSLLAKIDDQPAIYDRWAVPNAPMPRINFRLSSAAGNHWARRDSTLYVDIWAPGPSSTTAENIRNQVIAALDRQRLQGTGFDAARLALESDGIVEEDNPSIVHWNIQFSLRYWRTSFIAQLGGVS